MITLDDDSDCRAEAERKGERGESRDSTTSLPLATVIMTMMMVVMMTMMMMVVVMMVVMMMMMKRGRAEMERMCLKEMDV